MIDLRRLILVSFSEEDLFSRIVMKDSSSFHFVAVSTLVSSDLDSVTWSRIQNNQIICDSRYLSLVSRIFGHHVRQIRGSDFLKYFFNNSYPTTRHLVLGSTEHTLSLLSKEVQLRYPNMLNLDCQSLPFLSFQSKEDFACVDKYFIARTYDVVWVALGSPKQDKVALYIAEKFGIPTIAIGAAVDFLAGTKSEAPWIIRILGFEWCFRLLSEPSRLWRRYLIGNTVFIYALIKLILWKTFRRNRGTNVG